jgi:dolichyl-phosphate-mannose--protein O-mannosyl transferase
MACTWGSKVNGILTVFTIGIAVIIDLWDVLDIKKGHSMVRFYPFLHPQGLTTIPGLLYKALGCKSIWIDSRAFHRLSFLFLRPLLDPHNVWSW